jgi:hypothetical protein
MSFYPIFIPMNGGGGGGGSPGAFLAAYCGAIGLLVCGLHYMHSPTVSLKVKENWGGIVTTLKHTDYPKFKKVESKNLDCLREKGYSIKNNSGYHFVSQKDKASLAIAKKGLTKEEFLADCKECNVRTEVTYTYRGPFWKSRCNKSFEWHKCYKDKVE